MGVDFPQEIDMDLGELDGTMREEDESCYGSEEGRGQGEAPIEEGEGQL